MEKHKASDAAIAPLPLLEREAVWKMQRYLAQCRPTGSSVFLVRGAVGS